MVLDGALGEEGVCLPPGAFLVHAGPPVFLVENHAAASLNQQRMPAHMVARLVVNVLALGQQQVSAQLAADGAGNAQCVAHCAQPTQAPTLGFGIHVNVNRL